MAVTFAPNPARCTVHNLPMLATQSGLQQVCQDLDCEEHVRFDGPHEEAPVVKMSKEERQKLIEEAATKKAKEGTLKVTIPPPTKKAKVKKDEVTEAIEDADDEPAPKKAKKEKDPTMVSISDIAREAGIDPKVARSKLRKDGARAPEGRWQPVKRDGKEHKRLLALFTPSAEDASDDDEEAGDDEE